MIERKHFYGRCNNENRFRYKFKITIWWKFFFNFLLGLVPNWDFIPNWKYSSENNIIISPIDKLHIKFHATVGSKLNNARDSVPFSFTSDKLPGYRSFYKPETIHYKNIIEPLPRKKPFYFEHNTKDKVVFIAETSTLTLSMKTT